MRSAPSSWTFEAGISLVTTAEFAPLAWLCSWLAWLVGVVAAEELAEAWLNASRSCSISARSAAKAGRNGTGARPCECALEAAWEAKNGDEGMGDEGPECDEAGEWCWVKSMALEEEEEEDDEEEGEPGAETVASDEAADE